MRWWVCGVALCAIGCQYELAPSTARIGLDQDGFEAFSEARYGEVVDPDTVPCADVCDSQVDAPRIDGCERADAGEGEVLAVDCAIQMFTNPDCG